MAERHLLESPSHSQSGCNDKLHPVPLSAVAVHDTKLDNEPVPALRYRVLA